MLKRCHEVVYYTSDPEVLVPLMVNELNAGVAAFSMFDQGVEFGFKDGLQIGHRSGYKKGYKKGFEAGLNASPDRETELFKSVP